jgi:hypothetical protein
MRAIEESVKTVAWRILEIYCARLFILSMSNVYNYPVCKEHSGVCRGGRVMKIQKYPVSRILRFSFILIISMVIFLSANSSEAATLFVTSLNDSGPGSLRQTVSSSSSGDTIKFGVTGTITLTTGEIVIDKSLSIVGPDPSLLAISGNNNSRVFFINPNRTLEISGLTIRNGKNLGTGGGIYNIGRLKAANIHFLNNQSSGGAALYLAGEDSSVEKSIFDGNVASSLGAAILANSGINTISESSFFSNQANYGAALHTGNQTTVTIKNSTFNANIGDQTIWASYSNTTMNLINCTLAGNNGRALDIGDNVTVNAINTIFASSVGASNCNKAITGVNINNLDFGGAAPLNNCGAAKTGNPTLFDLGYYGGITPTMAVLQGSAALDAGSTTNYPTTDQRGWPRPYGSAPDIGAYEYMPDEDLDIEKFGSGTVKSIPPGIFCGPECSGSFPENSTVSLMAVPSPGNFIFTSWTGTGCGSTVLMNTGRTCRANFMGCSSSNPVEATPNVDDLSSITAAYNSPLLHQGLQLKVTGSTRLESLTFNRSVDLVLLGGYDCGFDTHDKYTFIEGHFFVERGSVVVDRIIIL